MGPQGLLRLTAAKLQVRIGTHSREPYLALVPEGGGAARAPTIVVEAAYLVETEEQLLKSLQLWMSDACDCQVGLGCCVQHVRGVGVRVDAGCPRSVPMVSKTWLWWVCAVPQ